MVVMGRVIAPFGIKGWVRLRTWTQTEEALASHPVWWLGNAGHWASVELEDYEVHAKGVVAKLKGVDDRTAAQMLKGRDVGVPREALGKAGKGEIYWVDLAGFEVVNLEGVVLGEMAGRLDTVGNDVMMVKGDKEYLIPFVDAYVKEVSPASRRITVDWGRDY
jgi:16S rRNA processing protein RimM